MKTLNSSLMILCICGFGILNTNAQNGTWTQKNNFGGTARAAAVGFSIGSKGYIGTGHDGAYQQDFWEWDQATNVWTQKANFGGTARYAAVGFSIGTKGYIGTGFNGGTFQDFWEWDQATDTWTAKTNFGGTARCYAAGFSVGTKGYIVTGTNAAVNTFYSDFWEWDQATNVWTQQANFGGATRLGAVGFSIGSKGYIGTGWRTAYKQDFWEWDQATNIWTQKTDFCNARGYAVGFSIGIKGYIGTGSDGVNKQDLWEFDAAGTGTSCQPLPVELLYFNAIAENNTRARCKWTTATEINNDYFAVERSKEGTSFEQIGTVKGAGNSSATLNYVFYDEHPYTGISYYRLKQVDYNGAFTYSPIRSVYIGVLDIISIYPNPSSNGYISYKVVSQISQTVKIKVHDVLGREIIIQDEVINAGITEKKLSTAGLADGSYILQIITEQKEQAQKQFVIK